MAAHGEGFHRGERVGADTRAARRARALGLGMDVLSNDVPTGRFGRLFDGLPTFEAPNEAIRKVAALMRQDAETGLDSDIPLGFAFLGQFIDHDITFDPVSRLDERLDPTAIRNFRTPALDLDSLYGEGPDASRHLYDTRGDSEHRLPMRLLTGHPDHPRDLPRNHQGTAIIGDPRNDENLLISQLHAALLRFHNAVVKRISAGAGPNPPSNKDLFEQARRTVVDHYHYVIVEEFLPLVVGRQVTDDVRVNGRKIYRWEERSDRPYIPVEFSGAAYRMGHTLIRAEYAINSKFDHANRIALFDLPFFGVQKTDFGPGSKHAPVTNGYDRSFEVDFSYFVKTNGNAHVQFCRPVDAKVTAPLFDLPFIHNAQDAPSSLPERNMRRARTLKLPSGQTVAAAMGVSVLTNEQLGLGGIPELGGGAPLWFYILKESEIRGEGRLGPVGGRIVAETILGLIEFVQRSYDPTFEWSKLRQTLNAPENGFTLADLLTFGSL